MKKQLLNKLKKYQILIGILLFFLIWILFFDEYNLFRIRRDNKKLQQFKEEKIYLEKKIEEDRLHLQKLQTDPNALERYAREEYLLKKEDEEVYIIIEE